MTEKKRTMRKAVRVIHSPHFRAFSAVFIALLMNLSMVSLHAQNRLSFNMQNVTIEQAIGAIEKQTAYRFLYNKDIVDTSTKVSLNVRNQTIEAALNQLFKNTPIRYTISEKQIVLTSSGKAGKEANPTPTLPRFSGTIFDSKGSPVIGATVRIKGSDKGTVTNYDGNFVLTDVPQNAVVSVSYIGYRTTELIASTPQASRLILQEDTELLDEVVVVGYGIQRKVNLTGAVSSISGKDINERPVVSAASALQGADPSLNIAFNTGSPASGYNINIRGVVSVNGGSPLILVDGIESSLTQINPNDIESISVLKDASSSAIYGAKASSGVVLVTTKKGSKSGKAKISYSGRYGFSQNTTSNDYITTGYDHVNIVNKFYKIYQGRDMLNYTEADMALLLERRDDVTEHPDRPWTLTANDGKYMYYGNHDWYNYFYQKNRAQQEHNVSITGGNDKLDYYVSGRYLQQEGIFKIQPDMYDNYSFRTKIGAQLTPWLRYSNNVNYNVNEYTYAGYRNEQQTIHSLQSNIISSFVPFNPDGSIMQYPNQLTANSPIGAGHGGYLTANKARNSRGTKQLMLSNQFDITLAEGLVLTGMHSYRNYNRLNTYRNLPFEYSRQENVFQSFTSGTIYNEYREVHYTSLLNSFNVYASYNKSFNEEHNLSAVAGTQFEDFRAVENELIQRDLLNDNLSSFSVATGEAQILQSISTYATLGYFGRVNYDYKGRYLFEASGRYDGSSRFSPTQRWGFFPSASAGWRISEEEFWTPLNSFWDNAKLRASYGSLGNQQVSNYSYIDQISTDRTMSYTFDGKVVANYASVTDPISSTLTWETVSTYNVGLDLGFLNNRLNATADFFIRDTRDMLTPSLTLPSVFGARTPKENAADLRTNGWELQLSWRDRFSVAGKPLEYTVSASLGDYTTKITSFNNPDKLISDFYVGQTLGEIWGYRVDGLFASDEEAAEYQSRINDKAVNNRVYSSKIDNILMAGDVKFRDLNNDDIISEGAGTVENPGDKEIIGNSLPRYSYSFRLGANWNGFDISAFFQGVGEQDWAPASLAYDFWGPYSFPSLSFIHKDFLTNTWSEENPGAYFPRPRGYASYSAGALGVVNDRYLQDVSYLRLKNLTIGYTLPVLKSTFQQIKIFATGENLFYWSALKKNTKVVDPELTNTSSTYNSGSGVGYTYSKSFSAGVNITF
jgi:TonB-linked SusC/RagA family outer membrane protein